MKINPPQIKNHEILVSDQSNTATIKQIGGNHVILYSTKYDCNLTINHRTRDLIMLRELTSDDYDYLAMILEEHLKEATDWQELDINKKDLEEDSNAY